MLIHLDQHGQVASARETSRRIILDPPPKAALTHMTAIGGFLSLMTW